VKNAIAMGCESGRQDSNLRPLLPQTSSYIGPTNRVRKWRRRLSWPFIKRRPTAAFLPTGPLCQPECVEIVHADPAEATELRDLHLITWELTYRDRADEAWYRERLAAHAVRDWGEIVRSQAALGGGVLTARSDGRIVGLCEYGPTEDPDHDPKGIGQIRRLYVHPARQRTGIGRSLLTASVDALCQGGAHTATLWVPESDQRARAFYEQLGWKPDGTRRTHPPTDIRYGLPLH
jgi:ribosomal protein S18 acetylase RimI-like enzyme